MPGEKLPVEIIIDQDKQSSVTLRSLPYDVHRIISVSLPHSSRLNLAHGIRNHRFYLLYKNDIEPGYRQVKKLLEHAARGEQQQVIDLIKNDPGLLLEINTVTDYSGRTFKSLTAFQYAVWARDFHMWEAILDCLPCDRDGESIRKELLKQYDELVHKGLTYKLNGQIYNESRHYDFKPIKDAYQAYQQYYKNVDWEKMKIHKLDKQYCEATQGELMRLWLAVGQIQATLPAHVIQEYFHKNRAFLVNGKLPRFDKAEGLTRLTNFNWSGIPFYPLKPALGVYYSITRGKRIRQTDLVDRASWWNDISHVNIDAAAIDQLVMVRTRQAFVLREQLNIVACIQELRPTSQIVRR
jgi:hypothetical protein